MNGMAIQTVQVSAALAGVVLLAYGMSRLLLRDPGRLGQRRTGAVAAIAMVLLLGALLWDVSASNGATIPADAAVNAALAPYRNGILVPAFVWITSLGTGATTSAVAVTTTGLLWAGRWTKLLLPLWGMLLGAQATTWGLKFAVARARPPFIEGVSAASPSFPSAHATVTLAIYGFVAYAVARGRPDPRERFEVAFWTAAFIALVGFSRLFLSLHYLTDVAGGFLVGGLWLLAGCAAAEWMAALAPGGKSARAAVPAKES